MDKSACKRVTWPSVTPIARDQRASETAVPERVCAQVSLERLEPAIARDQRASETAVPERVCAQCRPE